MQAWDRYAYVSNNPVKYNDPTGNNADCGIGMSCVVTPPDKRDLTKWMVAACVDGANSVEMKMINSMNASINGGDKAAAYVTFYHYVKDGGKYDVKDKMKANLKTSEISLGGKWFEYSTAGNILYGFYGLAAGFTAEELHEGAGVAQIMDHILDSDHPATGDSSTY